MINLFESYTQESKDLVQTLKHAGFDFKTIVLNESGFLPKDIVSPYGYFLNFSDQHRNGCYFNQVKVPDFWDIRSNNAFGEIFEDEIKRATIHYIEPTHQRIVDRVDWLDKNGQLMFVEHYNQYGKIFAKTYYNGKPQPIFRTYVNEANEEIILEHYEVGSVILNVNHRTLLFKSQFEFYHYFFKVANIDTSKFIINSLSKPFLLTYDMDKSGQDILFWQEPIYNEIPGNMQIILNGNERVKKIFVQQPDVYDKLMQLANAEQQQKIEKLGYIYQFNDTVKNNQDVLILTNSDQIEHLKEIVEQSVDINFHIGALTEMSSKLMSFAIYDNVRLYPNIRMNRVTQLFQQCNVYLDINHGNEIVNAVRTAFEHNQVIIGFHETKHSDKFIAKAHLFTVADYAALIAKLHQVIEHTELKQDALQQQHVQAGQETKHNYELLLKLEI